MTKKSAFRTFYEPVKFDADAPIKRGVPALSASIMNEGFTKEPQNSSDRRLYQAPLSYVGIFYLALVVWTIVSVTFLGLKEWTNWTQLFVIAFILVFTWYFSLRISYQILLEGDGTIWLKSFRRVIRTRSLDIQMVEGPHLPIGFIRFRLEREKAYLFCVVNDKDLQAILSLIRKFNPDAGFKNV
jgi:hypothetical protein